MLAALGRDDLAGITFAAAQAGRAAIGRTSTPQTAAHEGAFGEDGAAASARKLANATAWRMAVPAQNTIAGGWRESQSALVHDYSGMRCPKTMTMALTKPDGSVEEIDTALIQIRLYAADGMDTSCDFADPDNSVYVTLYASHWPDVPVEEHFAAALKLIVDRIPLKEEAPVLTAVPSGKGEGYSLSTEPGDTLAAAFITEPMNGVTFKTALWLIETGGWHVKARATFPVGLEDGKAAISVVEMVTTTMHAAAYRDVDAHAKAAQTVSFGGF